MEGIDILCVAQNKERTEQDGRGLFELCRDTVTWADAFDSGATRLVFCRSLSLPLAEVSRIIISDSSMA